MNEMIYEIKSQYSYDPRSYGRNFSNCVEKPEKIQFFRRKLGPKRSVNGWWCSHTFSHL